MMGETWSPFLLELCASRGLVSIKALGDAFEALGMPIAITWTMSDEGEWHLGVDLDLDLLDLVEKFKHANTITKQVVSSDG